MFNRSDVGIDGMVRVWDVPDQCWKRVHAVDAREQIGKGTANMDGPEIEMQGPAGLCKVFQRDVEAYKSKGYVVVAAPDKALKTFDAAAKEKIAPEKVELGAGEKPGDKGAGGGGGSAAELVDFTKFSEDQIRGFADHAGIKKANKMTVPQIIEELDKAKFVPGVAPANV